jgi:hypothetical protein
MKRTFHMFSSFCKLSTKNERLNLLMQIFILWTVHIPPFSAHASRVQNIHFRVDWCWSFLRLWIFILSVNWMAYIKLRRAVIAQSVQRWPTDWTIGVLGFDSWRGLGIFPSQPRPELLWAPPSLLSNGCQGFLPWGLSGWGVRLTTHLHLVPRSKNEWSYTSTSQYAFMAWCLVMHRDNFTFTLHGSNLRWITG